MIVQQPFRLSMLVALTMVLGSSALDADEAARLKLTWKDNILLVTGDHVPGREIEIWYLEAYCRANSHETDWGKHTVVGHETKLVDSAKDGSKIKLQCRVADGLIVDHLITAKSDEVDFHITAHNATQRRSEVHWAQPCVRVGKFTGTQQDEDKYAYVPKSFIFLDGKLHRMPTTDWATKARYTPGQVWAAPGVPASDVNPRPLSPHRPKPGIIGCYSDDEQMMLAICFEPYQELFQGVIRCLHSDFRLGGLKPGEKKTVRGKLYLLPADDEALLARYLQDFAPKR